MQNLLQKIIKTVLIIIFSILILLIILLISVKNLAWSYTDSELKNKLNHLPHKVFNDKINGRNIRSVEVGNDDLPITILLHGSPNTLREFFQYPFLTDTNLLNHTALVAIDRPGYGGSDFGNIEISAWKQAELMRPVIERYKNRKITVVGFSYGGTVAAALAMQNPEVVHKTLLCSASLIAGEEYVPAIARWCLKPSLAPLVPELARLASVEKIGHFEVLKEIEPHWGKIKGEVRFIHGDTDDLIYYTNATKAMELLNKNVSKSLITQKGIGHLVLKKNPKVIKDTIIELAK
ncbi:MAG: alpha/beta hydrolase [Spirosomaceae bacterium]|jgi:pimeloyl-ACP methyl ester carboxylesterase|nr:alpha/beta hydrolase [Spirosomataceae bacterium]